MTEHLPECPPEVCICSYLRACEQRVIDSAVQRVEALEIPYDLPLPVTSKIWNRIISQCVDAIKRDQP